MTNQNSCLQIYEDGVGRNDNADCNSFHQSVCTFPSKTEVLTDEIDKTGKSFAGGKVTRNSVMITSRGFCKRQRF